MEDLVSCFPYHVHIHTTVLGLFVDAMIFLLNFFIILSCFPVVSYPARSNRFQLLARKAHYSALPHKHTAILWKCCHDIHNIPHEATSEIPYHRAAFPNNPFCPDDNTILYTAAVNSDIDDRTPSFAGSVFNLCRFPL